MSRWWRRFRRWLWWLIFRGRGIPLDTSKFRHVYVGPDTRGGLTSGTPIWILGGRGKSGNKSCLTPDGRSFMVPPSQLEVMR